MKESVKTLLFVAVAATLAIMASVIEPESATPKLMSDQGEEFYPKFRDPQAVKTIEVIDYDESTATARPFQVEQQKGRWVLSSNNDYPVDIGDRLVKTAGALMDLKKDLVKSDSVQDHAKYGVVDPLDQKAAGLTGRGKRVTLRDSRKDVLADFILGKPVEGKAGFRYVRVPGEKRVYAVKTDADPSTKFSDWVNSGIARIPLAQIRKVSILSYQLDESAGTVSEPDQLSLTREGENWAMAGAEHLNLPLIQTMARALDNLKIVDARPKPDTLAQSLRTGQLEVTLESALSLRQKGFFVTQSGRLMASEGEMSVDTVNGVVYQLRFGGVAATQGESKPSGNRYLFVMTVFDPARAAKYGGDAAVGERQAKDSAARFADWYYVITNDEFQQLRLKKKDVVR
jgi:hypothetical protein